MFGYVSKIEWDLTFPELIKGSELTASCLHGICATLCPFASL